MNRSTRLYLAWVVALVATLGSLYLSEVLGYRPCKLCWYQRIAMYPLALMLGIAAFRDDLRVRLYAAALALIGAITALVQNAEIWGWIPTLKSCSIDAGQEPCTTIWPLWSTLFGEGASALNSILTIPVLSMIAFSLILALLAWPRMRPEEQAQATYTEPHDRV
ncbi:disulfide bond formation protein DsbB [Deinococcus proteolyticus MRP]|uniref:Disulfide bond formation protein DsbB n=1 Tax=Deinococcus proteolyticus (strain ATCC 35074 / DSM 20540 / JCM 6276 / NBRC 101906 / NCIMB 13154 / VKM Ac-1939 / CCM 2703 / MRP) TaxID=693977 RepID=F0RKA1_DEIPM|nr:MULTISPECIES: disulfide bond formation protein B [Deinococcus]ADY25660.1 disulfide bond formation protein DsbB [Deinococcus proteolyticus MRP]MCY1701777.1 disulfide bond formation protein B [Deinococcus sp. SL84]